MTVGRCCWRLLGPESTSAARDTGHYGLELSNDVARCRQRLAEPGDPNTVGATLWARLYPYGDALGAALFTPKPLASLKPTPTCHRLPLVEGMQGGDVQGMQRALWRGLQGSSTNARNGNFGEQTVADIGRFRERYDFNRDDSDAKCGGELWAALTRWMDKTAVDLVHTQPPPDPMADIDALCRTIAEEALYAQAHNIWTYSQQRAMWSADGGPATIRERCDAGKTTRQDCSTLVTEAHHSAGAPNPNRSDGRYDGYGYTGTLQTVCRRFDTARLGDIGLYDSNYDGTSSHATIVADLSPFRMVSHGSDPIAIWTSPHHMSGFMGYYRSPHLID